MRYGRSLPIQGTVYNGTINGTAPVGTVVSVGVPGTQNVLTHSMWGPQTPGMAWIVKGVSVGGLSSSDAVGIYRNSSTLSPVGFVTGTTPWVLLGCVLLPGDQLMIGHYPSQTASNTYGTLTAGSLQAAFEYIECTPQELGNIL